MDKILLMCQALLGQVVLLVLMEAEILLVLAIMHTEEQLVQLPVVELEEVYVLPPTIILIELTILVAAAALAPATTVVVAAEAAVSMPTAHIMAAQQVEVAVSERVEKEEIPVVLIPDITVAVAVLAQAVQAISAVRSKMPQQKKEMNHFLLLLVLPKPVIPVTVSPASLHIFLKNVNQVPKRLPSL